MKIILPSPENDTGKSRRNKIGTCQRWPNNIVQTPEISAFAMCLCVSVCMCGARRNLFTVSRLHHKIQRKTMENCDGFFITSLTSIRLHADIARCLCIIRYTHFGAACISVLYECSKHRQLTAATAVAPSQPPHKYPCNVRKQNST